MNEKYYKDLMIETNRKRVSAGMNPFTWKEYKKKIKIILDRERRFLQDYDETGDKEAEEME